MIKADFSHLAISQIQALPVEGFPVKVVKGRSSLLDLYLDKGTLGNPECIAQLYLDDIQPETDVSNLIRLTTYVQSPGGQGWLIHRRNINTIRQVIDTILFIIPQIEDNHAYLPVKSLDLLLEQIL